MEDCLFCKFVKTPDAFNVSYLYEDDLCIVFQDINPKAETHLLIVPKKHVSQLSNSGKEDVSILGHLLYVSKLLSDKYELPDYNIKINNGAGAGQEIFHLHLHFLSNKRFK